MQVLALWGPKWKSHPPDGRPGGGLFSGGWCGAARLKANGARAVDKITMSIINEAVGWTFH